MKRKTRGILILFVSFLALLVVFIGYKFSLLPRAEDDSEEIVKVTEHEPYVPADDSNNNEIENQEKPIPLKIKDFVVLKKRNYDEETQELKDKNIQENSNDNQAVFSNDKGLIQELPEEEQEEDERGDIISPGLDKNNGKIQLENENPDDSFGPIIRGK